MWTTKERCGAEGGGVRPAVHFGERPRALSCRRPGYRGRTSRYAQVYSYSGTYYVQECKPLPPVRPGARSLLVVSSSSKSLASLTLARGIKKGFKPDRAVGSAGVIPLCRKNLSSVGSRLGGFGKFACGEDDAAVRDREPVDSG